MHDWHQQAGALFMHAGNWLRPEYYKTSGPDRESAILTEATHVRRAVGMVDVGTLGKLQISGPDAVIFLERIYTGHFRKLVVGKLRYCLACDETGVIIDDGIVARLAEDLFYVTATSSGAAAFYRELQRWALLWGMDVTLANLTGHLGAMNIAGPASRQVLSQLTDLDLSADAFPFVAVRQTTVAGTPAKLLRVGFVGELGFEIHVSASCALHVWDAIMEAGRPMAIAPFGVEAQRLLRLEKGHLIVSQDTDALTNPYEADLSWAIGKNKPFFVGQRSLEVMKAQPSARRLVGFSIDPAHTGPLPKECHLVIAGRQIAGRVTSICGKSTLKKPLGLAYVHPDQTDPGTRIQIRVDRGKLIEAEVVPLPFYDPENARQKS